MEKIKEQRIAFNKVYSERQGLYLEIIQKAGLPEIPYRILYAICEEEPGKLSQMDICHIWNFPKQSVNTAINRLIKLGYVTLSQDRTAARNRKIIDLTDAGKEYCKTWVYPLLQADLKAFRTLSVQERDMYIEFIARQRDSLKKSMQALLGIKK